MPEYRTYDDSHISITVPSYLRWKSKRLFFEAPRSRKVGQPISLCAASVLDNESLIQSTIRELTSFRAGLHVQGTSETRVIRQGMATWLPDGIELLHSRTYVSRKEVDLELHVLFTLGGIRISVTVDGNGDPGEFDRDARSIVQSIRLLDASLPPTSSILASKPAGSMSDDQKRRLGQVVSGLPAGLTHLREAILAIADQDQSLLGSGDGDLTVLDECMRKVASSEPIGTRAERDADRLRQWLETVPGSQSSWAGPLWFIEGSLRGMAIWAEED